ncbi:hypothetical protein ACHAXR_010532 [Thalassiosira sp. AJA248-18]
MATTSNDGGIVASLFLMTGTIAFAICNMIALYESSTRTTTPTANGSGNSNARLLRLLSGWANMGNSFIHILLTIYMLSNTTNDSEYWVEERKLGGIEGPVGLAILNFLAGMSALRGNMKFPLGWNCFVTVLGTLMPIVWPRFIEVGLTSWPYIVIFVWFGIFFFELMAVMCSVAHMAIVTSERSCCADKFKSKDN